MKRLFAALTTALVLSALIAAPSAATDNAKWFVCKYVGTPGVDEVLQTGNNPISVSENAISISPVVAGTFFADSQGRSYVLVEDTGQPEPNPNLCPPPDNNPPTPTPVPPTPSPSPTPTPIPSEPVVTPEPSEPVVTPEPSDIVIGEFSIETCPLTGDPVPVGQSAFSLRGSVLLILLLNVRVDGQLVTLRDVLGDGTVGEVFVTPGEHVISISNAADTEVLAEDTVFCPECNPAVVTQPPHHTAPPTDLVSRDSTATPTVWPVALLLLTGAGAALVVTRKRR